MIWTKNRKIKFKCIFGCSILYAISILSGCNTNRDENESSIAQLEDIYGTESNIQIINPPPSNILFQEEVQPSTGSMHVINTPEKPTYLFVENDRGILFDAYLNEDSIEQVLYYLEELKLEDVYILMTSMENSFSSGLEVLCEQLPIRFVIVPNINESDRNTYSTIYVLCKELGIEMATFTEVGFSLCNADIKAFVVNPEEIAYTLSYGGITYFLGESLSSNAQENLIENGPEHIHIGFLKGAETEFFNDEFISIYKDEIKYLYLPVKNYMPGDVKNSVSNGLIYTPNSNGSCIFTVENNLVSVIDNIRDKEEIYEIETEESTEIANFIGLFDGYKLHKNRNCSYIYKDNVLSEMYYDEALEQGIDICDCASTH